MKEVLKVERTVDAFYTGGDVLWTSEGNKLFCQAGSAVNLVNYEDGSVDMSFRLDEEEAVTAIALSPNNQLLVIASKNDLLRQFNWQETGTNVCRNWRGMFKTPVVKLEFDVNDRLIASGSADGALKVWDLVSKYCTHNLKGGSGMFTMLRFHPTEHLLFGATVHSGTLFCWSLEDSALKHQLEAHTSAITDLQFVDSKKALTSSRDKVVVVWNLSAPQKLRSIPVFEQVESLMLLKAQDAGFGEEHFVTVGNKGVLKVWHMASGKCVKEQDEKTAAVVASDSNTVVVKGMFNRLISSFAVVTYEQNIVFHETEHFKTTKRLTGNYDQILDLSILGRDEGLLAICTNSALIRVLNRSDGHTSLLKGHLDIVLCLAIAKSYPNLLVSGSKDNDIRIWDCEKDEMQCLNRGRGHTHSVGALAVSKLKADSKGNIQIFSGGEDKTLKMWSYNLDDNKISSLYTVRAHDKDVMSIDITLNNQLVASGSQDKTVKLWKAANLGELAVLRGHRRGIWCVRFSADEPILASASTDTTIKIWNIDDSTCMRTFEGHECSVLRVMFVSNSQQLLSAGADGNLKLWNMRSNDCAETFDGHQGRIWALTASEDEMTFVSGAADAKINIWKDVTVEVKEAALQRQETMLLEEQNLLNLIQAKKWSQALRFALNLEHPQRALNIVKAIMYEDEAQAILDNALRTLEPCHENTLLGFCATWNMNAKHCYAAQVICKTLLASGTPSSLLEKWQSLGENCAALLVYTERHLERLQRLEQQSMILDYMLKNMHVAGDIQ